MLPRPLEIIPLEIKPPEGIVRKSKIGNYLERPFDFADALHLLPCADEFQSLLECLLGFGGDNLHKVELMHVDKDILQHVLIDDGIARLFLDPFEPHRLRGDDIHAVQRFEIGLREILQNVDISEPRPQECQETRNFRAADHLVDEWKIMLVPEQFEIDEISPLAQREDI